MRVLLVKTSSMGDVIHTLPAVTDAAQAQPGISFDWLVEEAFAEIPAWHPAVTRVIPIALRQWRKSWWHHRRDLWALKHQLRQTKYDLIIDAQALVKSALLACLAKGPRVGLDWQSAREPIASLAYHSKYAVNFYQHAVLRMRLLFSQALGYDMPLTAPSFGLDRTQFLNARHDTQPYLVFLHGTTWDSKQWPEIYWQELAALAIEAGFRIKISGGNAAELARAERIGQQHTHVEVLPRQTIAQMAGLLANSQGAVAVDTGFAHLAGALQIPIVSLYGSTNPAFSGALGERSLLLAADFPCAPCLSRQCRFTGAASVTPACYGKLPPLFVWSQLQALLAQQSPL